MRKGWRFLRHAGFCLTRLDFLVYIGYSVLRKGIVPGTINIVLQEESPTEQV
jgi:hypothetical protein